ncbi:MAG: hypothetical protein KA184_19545, partial [Candidatus Hydrogenedentes bacterium]|nr:hypothetical protein [Candidatus Hydrogenedentota bacterium]
MSFNTSHRVSCFRGATLGLVIILFVMAGLARGGPVFHGVNITVEAGSVGLPAPPAPRHINGNADPWNDIYKAGGVAPNPGSTSLLRLDKALLGLLPHDDIDAFSYPDANVTLPPPVIIEDRPVWADGIPGGGWEDSQASLIYWHFSVDELAIGVFKPLAMPPVISAVNLEVTAGTSWNVMAANPNEAHGDYFIASTAFPGGKGNNYLGADEEQLTLDILPPLAPHAQDDLNGLDLEADLINHPETPLQPGELFFSLSPASPSLA